MRVYVYAAANRGTFKRMFSYLSFMISASFLGPILARPPDVVLATSPQLLCGVAGWFLGRFFQVPFIFEVRDLWPESITAVEAMRENAVTRGLRSIASMLYHQSRHIITVGEGYRRRIHELYGISLEKMEVVHNGIDPDLFRPGLDGLAIRREFGWGDRFTVLYMGTLGMAHALDKVLEAASILGGDPRILFAFVGEGAEKEKLIRKTHEMMLNNVMFVPGQPKASVPAIYSACDVGIVTLRDTPLFQDVLPSKIFEYLSMERPIILGVGGEARRLVEASGGGVYVPPENPRAIAEAVRHLAANRGRILEMGKRGRAYVLENYDRKSLARKYIGILERVIRPGVRSPAP